MNAQNFFRRNRRRLAWAALTLQGTLVTFGSIAYSISPPHPDVHAQLGLVSIELEKLDYTLTFADLQSAGMFVNVRCRKCDFSAKATRTPSLAVEDLKDARFMSTLFKGHRSLSMTFYGENIPAGQRQLHAALMVLRAKFPGKEDAIKLVYGEYEDNYDDFLRQEREPTPP